MQSPVAAQDFLMQRGSFKVYQRCWQPICRGIAHPNPYTVQNARANLQTVIGQVPRAAEIIASDVIKFAAR